MVVDIAEIPSEWGKFPNSEDLWKRVDYGEKADISGCLYQANVLKFLNHVHEKSDEIITNTTPNSIVTIYTPKWYKEVRYGEAVFIPRGVEHIAVWGKLNMIVNIVWQPAMKGWQGEFREEIK